MECAPWAQAACIWLRSQPSRCWENLTEWRQPSGPTLLSHWFLLSPALSTWDTLDVDITSPFISAFPTPPPTRVSDTLYPSEWPICKVTASAHWAQCEVVKRKLDLIQGSALGGQCNRSDPPRACTVCFRRQWLPRCVPSSYLGPADRQIANTPAERRQVNSDACIALAREPDACTQPRKLAKTTESPPVSASLTRLFLLELLQCSLSDR